MTTAIDYTRQREFFDPAQHNASATIVGCGGIGSFTALALAKLGVSKLNLIDMDTVEEHNTPNQMFMATGDLGSSKVEALGDACWEYGGIDPVRYNSTFQDCDPFPIAQVVIAALDSMEQRAQLWDKVKMQFGCHLFLDGRLAGQKIVLYAVRPSNLTDINGYEATLYSDSEALEDSCTARSIIDVGFAVASLMARAVRLSYTQREPLPNITYLNQETLEMMKGGWLL